jgi:predicted glutamine amidotransferase
MKGAAHVPLACLWNDQNLREIAGHVRSPLFFAHSMRSSSGPAGPRKRA